jgi:alanyl-tRNA synthetase
LIADRDKLKKQVAQLASSGKVSVESMLTEARELHGARVVIQETPGATPNLMRQWIDQIRQLSDSPSAVLFAARSGENKVLLVAGVSRQLVERGLSAGQWISKVAPIVGGGGGGKPDLAQAGGKDASKIPQALGVAEETIAAMLAD